MLKSLYVYLWFKKWWSVNVCDMSGVHNGHKLLGNWPDVIYKTAIHKDIRI